MHRLLERQLKKVGRLAGAADDPLIQLIDEAYQEMDRERARQDRTHRALSEEVEALTASIRREAEARVRAVFDHVLDGIVVVDDDGVVDSINPAAERMFAVRGGVAVGQPFASLWGGAPPSGHRRASPLACRRYGDTAGADQLGLLDRRPQEARDHRS